MVDKLFDVTCEQFETETRTDIRRQLFIQSATIGMSDIERARFVGLPEGCRMREGAKIISPENLRIGTNVWIGENAILDASGGLEIGSNTSVGLGVYIWTHDSHKLNRAGTNTQAASAGIRRKPTCIKERCFIAGPSVIMPGVILGAGTIVAPMSVIYKNTEPDSTCTPYRDIASLLKRVEKLEKRLGERNG